MGKDIRAGVQRGNNPKPSGSGRGKRKDCSSLSHKVCYEIEKGKKGGAIDERQVLLATGHAAL